MNTKLVIVLGAGATYSDSSKSKIDYLPPLDKSFFIKCSSIYPKKVREIQNYFLNNYHRDIVDVKYDSFESVMSTVYTDIFDPPMRDKALGIFITLIRLFNRKLSDSTNRIRMYSGRELYRILIKYLDLGYNPKNISFITFNQDIQIERTLDYINTTQKWKDMELFSFPNCYSLSMAESETTGPHTKRNCFKETKSLPAKIKILKLHGSLNWYSVHDSVEFDQKSFFDPKRQLKITRRRQLNPELKYHSSNKPFTLPVVIPPVNNKSSVMHKQLRALWSRAQNVLKSANDVIFWGYSLPDLDFESRNLFTRNLKDSPNLRKVIVIDPDSIVVKKYIDILELNHLLYFSNAKSFLNGYFN